MCEFIAMGRQPRGVFVDAVGGAFWCLFLVFRGFFVFNRVESAAGLSEEHCPGGKVHGMLGWFRGNREWMRF